MACPCTGSSISSQLVLTEALDVVCRRLVPVTGARRRPAQPPRTGHGSAPALSRLLPPSRRFRCQAPDVGYAVMC